MKKISIAVIIALLPALAACEQSQSKTRPAAPPPPQVTVAKPVASMIADQDEYVGRFVAVESVEVRARVSGYLEAIHFQDGQIVKKGDLLFTIDRRPFETALAQAQASLAQASANLAFAEADLERAPRSCVGTRDHPADVRPAHAGQARRASDSRGAGGSRATRPRSTSNSPSCARRSPDASATGASRSAISSPAARRATPRCLRPSSRSIRSASSSPWMRPPTCATRASPRTAPTPPTAALTCRSRLKLIDETDLRP